MSGFGEKYLGLDVTYNASDLPTYVAYYLDAGKNELIEEYTMTYASGDHPIYLGVTLFGLQFNVGTAEFVVRFTLEPSITDVSLNPIASGVLETGVHQFDIPWTLATGVDIGNLITTGGTAPFVYSITSDPDNKFVIADDDKLRLDNTLNIFIDTMHTVTVRSTDANGKIFDVLLTFTVVVGPFSNDNSYEFLGTGDNLVGNVVSPNPTGVPFSISVWFKRTANNQVLLGRWDNSTECMFFIGMDSNRPRIWLSGDGTPGSFQGLRTSSTTTSNTWYNLIFTFSASTLNCYFAGSLDNGTTSGSAQTSMFLSATQVLEIGDIAATNPGGDGALDGFLDEISFWNTELTASDVSEIYNFGTPSDLSSHTKSASLMEWYRCGDSSIVAGFPNIVDGGAVVSEYANGATSAQISTDVPP
jgi:hypothetical protein